MAEKKPLAVLTMCEVIQKERDVLLSDWPDELRQSD